MAFPSISSTKITTSYVSGTGVHTINLPDTVYAGDLILIGSGYYDADNDATPPPISGGFSLLSIIDNGFSGGALWGKIASGSEGGTTVTITLGLAYASSISTAAVSIGGVNGGVVSGTDYSVATDNDFGSTSTPASVTAAWGSADNLFLIFDGRFIYNSNIGTVSSYPSGYTLANASGQHNANDFRSGATVCAKTNAAAFDTPGSFAWTVGTAHPAFTIAVRPGTSGGPSSALQTASVKVWNGSALQTASVKVWDGSALQTATASVFE